MKVAIVHSFYSGRTPSGENTVVRMQIDALRRAGHKVELFGVNTDDLSKDRAYKVRSAWNVVSGRGRSPLRQLIDFSPDVVHVHNLFPNYSTEWLDKWPGPIVTTVHNYRPVCAAGTLFRDGHTCTECPAGSQLSAVVHACYKGSRLATIPLAVRNMGGVNADPLLKRSDAIVFLSERSRRQYEDFGFAPARGFVVPNFVETQNRLLSSSDGRWVFVGRLSDEKGILPLLASWPSDQTLDIYGDGPLQPQVAELARDNVSWHGSVSRETILKVLPHKHGLVIPSVCAEQFPTVYAEALAAGIPVVAKSGNSAADDIALSPAGSVFDDWCQLGASLQFVSDNRPKLSEGAKKHYRESFTEDRWLSRMVDIYESAGAGGLKVAGIDELDG